MQAMNNWLLAGIVWWTAGMAMVARAIDTVELPAAGVMSDAQLSVGRIYKLTGAAFAGNRLVLRAKANGDLAGAQYSWKRDGVEVSMSERLDIASLKASDFGTYTLTVKTDGGTATSEGFKVSPAPAGVPVTWGDGEIAEMPPPPGVSGMVQLAAGSELTAALLSDGTVSVWGNDQGSGACAVPAGLSDVSQVAIGGSSWAGQAVFAVKNDGSVTSWGRTCHVETYWDDWAHAEYNEQTEEWKYTGDWTTWTNGVDLAGTMPSDLADVVKLSLDSDYALALTADGRVVGWGSEYTQAAEVPEGLSDVVDIAAGGGFALALKADGTVEAWGYSWEGATEVPASVTSAVAVAAVEWVAGIALLADGRLEAWGDQENYYGLTEVPVSTAGFTAAVSGANFPTAAALDAEGYVHVWGGAYQTGMHDVPAGLQGSVSGIALGESHCTALAADTDGDSIADVLEPLYGRNPEAWEPWERVTVGGTVTVEGAPPPGPLAVSLLDAAGNAVGRAEADEEGRWLIDGVIPGTYALRVEAPGAVDPDVAEVSTMGGAVGGLDFDLPRGEGRAMAKVEAHLAGNGEWLDEEDCSVVPLPEGTAIYLDMWPTKPGQDGLLDLGEVATSISGLDGTVLLPHLVSVKRPESGAQAPVQAPVEGQEGATVEACPHFSSESGSVRIVTEPAGAEVWVDYADKPLGVTPLTVGNLSAAASHAHILLLKKDGYLRPRPVEFRVEAGTEAEISIPLAAASEPAMSVAVGSAVPGMDIYVDYLPAGDVTPATVGGMDPASYEGDLWHSASHSILLRHPKMRPFAPRAVPDFVWDEESGEWVPCLDTTLDITAPNTYDDSDGDGVRNDRELSGGDNPFDPSDNATAGTPVPVPNTWLDKHVNALAAAGGDREAAAVADYDGDGKTAWEEYVAGTNPEDKADVFRVTSLQYKDGAWQVECEPKDEKTRAYQIEAASSLSGEFNPVRTDEEEGDRRFFRVGVSLK